MKPTCHSLQHIDRRFSACLGYDFGQHYSRIRIFEYDSYSDVKFLKFNINGPTTLANWSLTFATEGKCTANFANIHLYVDISLLYLSLSLTVIALIDQLSAIRCLSIGSTAKRVIS